MKNIKNCLSVFIIFCSLQLTYGQYADKTKEAFLKERDSLLNFALNAKNDSIKQRGIIKYYDFNNDFSLYLDVKKTLLESDSLLLLKKYPKANKEVEISRNLFLGMTFVKNHFIDESLKYFDEVIEITKTHKSDNNLNSALIEKAYILNANGKFDEALKYNLKALAIKDTTILISSRLANLNNIGSNLLSTEKYTEAEKYFKRVISLSDSLNYIGTNTIGSYLNLGALYYYDFTKLGNKQMSDSIRDVYIDLAEKKGDDDVKIVAYINGGNFLMMEGKYEEAKNLFNKCLKLKSLSITNKAFLYQGLYKSEKNDEEKALSYLINAKELLDSTEFYNEKISTMSLLSSHYEKNYDYKKALEYSKQFLASKDSLNKKEIKKNIDRLIIKHNVAGVKAENEILQLKSKKSYKLLDNYLSATIFNTILINYILYKIKKNYKSSL